MENGKNRRRSFHCFSEEMTFGTLETLYLNEWNVLMKRFVQPLVGLMVVLVGLCWVLCNSGTTGVASRYFLAATPLIASTAICFLALHLRRISDLI